MINMGCKGLSVLHSILFFLLLHSISACLLSHSSPPLLKAELFIHPHYQYSFLTSSHQKQIAEHACPSSFRLSQPTPPHYQHKPINTKDSGVIFVCSRGVHQPAQNCSYRMETEQTYEKVKLQVKKRQTKANFRIK